MARTRNNTCQRVRRFGIETKLKQPMEQKLMRALSPSVGIRTELRDYKIRRSMTVLQLMPYIKNRSAAELQLFISNY